MKKYMKFEMLYIIFLVTPMIFASEFVVTKKVKTKKESVAQVKDDVAELLESILRQVGKNICQSIDVQNNIFDKIKDIMTDNQLSTQQLKDLRNRLEKHLKILEDQQAELYDILLSCQKTRA